MSPYQLWDFTIVTHTTVSMAPATTAIGKPWRHSAWIIRSLPDDAKHAFYYSWWIHNWALGRETRCFAQAPGHREMRALSKRPGKTGLVRWLVLYFLSGKVFRFSCLQHFLNTYSLMENRLKKEKFPTYWLFQRPDRSKLRHTPLWETDSQKTSPEKILRGYQERSLKKQTTAGLVKMEKQGKDCQVNPWPAPPAGWKYF